MAALVTEQNYQGMSRAAISNRLYKVIDWAHLQSAGVFLSKDDEKLLESAQGNLEVVLDDAAGTQALVSLLQRIAENCTFDRSVQLYVFTRFEEIFGLGASRNAKLGDAGLSALSLSTEPQQKQVRTHGSKHVKLFLQPNGAVADGAFVRALSNPDLYLQKAAALSLAFIFTQLNGGNVDEHANQHGLDTLVNWVLSKIKDAQKTPQMLDHLMPALTLLASTTSTRLLLLKWGCLDAVSALLTRLGVTSNPQRLYELTFVLWTFSLVCDVARTGETGGDESAATIKSFSSAGTTVVLVDLLAARASRKIVRMVLATLHNLARTEDDDLLVGLFSTNIMRLLDGLSAAANSGNASSTNGSGKQSALMDPEYEADLKGLLEVLNKHYTELSTFERYASELTSGQLKWGIVHTEKFWKENCKLMEANDWKLLKLLVTYLSHSVSECVCIALYDLGEFARFFPNGRVVVKVLGAKDLALGLIQSVDEEVQKYALQCASKIMVNSWSMVLS